MSTKEITKDYIGEFGKAYNGGILGLTRAAEIYVAAIDENPEMREKFREAFDNQIPWSIWPQFEAIGRKCMHPRLLMGGVSDAKKSRIIKRLPYSLQESIFDRREKFELLTTNGDTLNVDVLSATPEQVEKLFDEHGDYRTLAEQKAYDEQLKSDAAVAEVAPEPMPYSIRRGRVSFIRPITLGKRDLQRIISEM